MDADVDHLDHRFRQPQEKVAMAATCSFFVESVDFDLAMVEAKLILGVALVY